jgi:hypothetical protein
MKKQSFTKNILFVISLSFTLPFFILLAQDQSHQFFDNGVYKTNIPKPEDIIGFPIGEKPVRYSEALKYLNILAFYSDRVTLVEFGETFERRKLHYLIISSKSNLENLSRIRSDIKKLSDPRNFKNKREADRIIENTPAIAWMMYGIHGDEVSSPDAALQLAYQLAAGEDTLSQKIREALIICIHPMENPDGRERYLAQMEQWNGLVRSDDVQSIQHTGIWPWGRGNHYLFDLNRDWILLINPESRARVKAISEWHPQLVVDSHEMGSLDTYLFSPPREPIHPQIKKMISKWSHQFAADQAKAFDKFGWSYYTKEWNEQWYPGYGTSWPFLLGAVGILYEQASTDGSAVKNREGVTLTFRESIHHQFISSVANLTTTAENRKNLLKDYYRLKQKALTIKGKSEPRTFYIVPDKNKRRVIRMLKSLTIPGAEVETAKQSFTVKDLHPWWDKKTSSTKLPKGTYIIRLAQPLRPLILSLLDFDPRMGSDFLAKERHSLLEGRGTEIYEVTAWSLPMAYDLPTYWSASEPKVETEFVQSKTITSGELINENPGYGYLFEYSDDSAIKTLAKLLDSGYKVRVAKKTFQTENKTFEKGSLLLRINENPPGLTQYLKKMVDENEIIIHGINTALSKSGPDLGGGEFQLLEQPRIAIFTGPGLSTTSFSSIWYLLDREFQTRHTLLHQNRFRRFDLSKYNILILPSTSGGHKRYHSIFGKEGIKKLKAWIQHGGTLIGIGNGAAFLADSSSELSKVELLRQSLDKLAYYKYLQALDIKLKSQDVDSIEIWEGNKTIKDSLNIKSFSKLSLKFLSEQDRKLRPFQPRGTILRANLDPEHWMSYGLRDMVPVIFYSDYAYLSAAPVRTPARLSTAENLRISGLLWPEARTRLASTAYATVEKIGKGQVILFAYDPFFRAYFYGSGRLLINSLLLGPGMGTSQTVPW